MNGLDEAAAVIRGGGVIAYPTEAVFGLGCLPGNEQAIERILTIKGREATRGLIIIGGSREQLAPWMAPLDTTAEATLAAHWPGPVTFVVKASEQVPLLLNGGRDTIAVRLSAMPLVAELCARCNSALVSTSANRSGNEALRSASDVDAVLGSELDTVLDAPTGGADSPSRVIELATGRLLRA
ncbi:MAG: tRNA threonylcarbamoyladenosine biosynthesis protein RimN [Gammaproteobacteria bacterium]|nr:MAG: tRNA threonylcarbamoyladenosine biosynthesis protein RimN [Gammaproteobacteria bacterium]